MVRRTVWVAAVIALAAAPAAWAQEREPNNTQDLADHVGAYVITGEISSGDDVDWFALGGQEGTHNSFTILHGDVDFDFDILDGGNTAGHAIGTDCGDSVECDVAGQGHVKVWSARGTGQYAIVIGGATEREPNNTTELADHVPGRALYGVIDAGDNDANDDIDWFVLEGQEGAHPTFTIYHGGDVDFDFEVYSGDASAGNAVGTESGDTLTCDVPGQGHVKVWSARGNGWYAIEVTPAQP